MEIFEGMKLVTAQQRKQMLANGKRRAKGVDGDPRPVVKIFHPFAAAVWLLAEINSNEPDIAYGLCDLGRGCPEIGYVALSELAKIRGPLGMPLERDKYFRAKKTLGEYAREASDRGSIAA